MKNLASEPGQSLMFGNGDGKFKLTINKVKVNSRSNDRYVNGVFSTPASSSLTKINPFQNYIYFLSSKRRVRNGDENFTHK